MRNRLLRCHDQEVPNGLLGDLYNASPGLLSQSLFKANNEIPPDVELIERLRNDARNVRTIQEYVRSKANALIEHRRKFEDLNFTMDIETEIDAYLSDLDAERVKRFNQIVEEIHVDAEQDPIDVLKLKQLAAEQYQLIYGNDKQRINRYRKQLGLPEEK